MIETVKRVTVYGHMNRDIRDRLIRGDTLVKKSSNRNVFQPFITER